MAETETVIGYRTRVVRGRGAAAGLWVVEWRMAWGGSLLFRAALPYRTRAEARAAQRVVREHGPVIGPAHVRLALAEALARTPRPGVGRIGG